MESPKARGRRRAAHLVGDEEDLIVRAERSTLGRWRPASRGESVEGDRLRGLWEDTVMWAKTEIQGPPNCTKVSLNRVSLDFHAH
jgi:hypothetical protein